MTFHNLGSYLKKGRMNVGLTQQELADELKLHGQYVSNWERGLCGPPLRLSEKVMTLLELDPKKYVQMLMKDTEQDIRKLVYPKKK